ncbi:MAG TPA: hypothetical protein VD927_11360 [Chryseosolibacter sp.]|nr:hypothetical protein [Chryseosolibacter sp.]
MNNLLVTLQEDIRAVKIEITNINTTIAGSSEDQRKVWLRHLDEMVDDLGSLRRENHANCEALDKLIAGLRHI